LSAGRVVDRVSELRTPPPAASKDRILRDCLDAFPEVVFAVTGRCMSPALAEGERVRLVPLARRRPRLGDVVLFRSEGSLRLHRLVWGPPLVRRTAGWRTQADRSSLVDPSLAEADVLGTVVAVLGRPYERRPLRALVSLARAVLARLRLALRAPLSAR
jgi:hypothetical protein